MCPSNGFNFVCRYTSARDEWTNGPNESSGSSGSDLDSSDGEEEDDEEEEEVVEVEEEQEEGGEGRAGEQPRQDSAEAYADAAETCKEAGKKIADACAGPWGPKPPPSFLAKLTGAAPFPDPAKVGRCKLNSRLVSFDPCLERRLVGFNS